MSGEERPKPTAQPVGHQLRRAREALGLDMSAIADQQHLRVSIIEAIEKGDYSKIDTELFLKGYVRAYAKQVGLNGDAIIRDLDIELEPFRNERQRQQEADPLVDIERRKRRKRRVAKTAMVVVVLAALAVGISSYLSEGQNPLPFGTPSTATDEPAPAETVVQSGTGAEAQVAETEAAELVGETEGQDQNSESELVPVTDEPATNEPMEVTAGEPAPVQAVPGNPETNLEEGQVSQNDTGSGSGDSVEAETAVTAEPESARDVPEAVADVAELIMTFNGDCWVQVSDAQGNRLASTLQREGDELRLDGTAPMNVIVGAMTAVESILFRGEPVDLDNIRTVNNRAQFTLEP